MGHGLPETLLILGGSGQLGSEVCRVFSDRETFAPSSSELPIEDEQRVGEFIDRVRSGVVVNCTAFHQLDSCERDPARAFAINAEAVGVVARVCAGRGIGFVTIGTDYVFSGAERRPYTETDREQPLNVYGISKLAGERYAAVANPKTIVFRLSGVFGRSGFSNKGPTFVERMITMAEKGEPIRVVDNVRFSPSYAGDVAETMRTIMEHESQGLFHLTNSGDCSWYELAVEAIRAAGMDAPVERTSYSNDGTSIKRPLYSVLAHDELRRRGYAPPRSWQSAVAAYVAERSARRMNAAAR